MLNSDGSSGEELYTDVMALNEVLKPKEQYFKSKVEQNEKLRTETNVKQKLSKDEDKPPGGCIRLIQEGVCRQGALCKYLHEPEEKMRETWMYYVRKLVGSKYRVSKEQWVDMYPNEEKRLRILTNPRNDGKREETQSEAIGDHQRSVGIFEEELSDDSNLLYSLLASNFPKLNYAERVHKDGILYPEDSEKLLLRKVLFDSGAQHASYISKELVDRHRDKLAHLIEKVDGEVRLGDNTKSIIFGNPLCKSKLSKLKRRDIKCTCQDGGMEHARTGYDSGATAHSSTFPGSLYRDVGGSSVTSTYRASRIG